MKALGCDSVFLSGNQPGERDFRRVLVLGGDALGVRMARRLAEEQFDVVLLGEAGSRSPEIDIPFMSDAVLEEVQGFAGDFQVVLRTPSGIVREKFGAIIAAQPPRLSARFDAYGIQADSRTLSLSDLEAKIESTQALDPQSGDWFHAAFLFGLDGESDPETFSRTLAAIERLRGKGQVQCYVFTRNLKVAADGLERRYRECRENGTLFFKFDGEGPSYERNGDKTTLAFKEPLLGIEMELTPDLLVVDEEFQPPPGLEPIWNAMPSSPACMPYLKPESPRFASVETPKAGILAVGASRGVFSPEVMDSDIEVALSCLKRLKTSDSEVVKTPGPPKIDPDKCAICLTCVRVCPHGAMGFTRHAFADPLSCMRCGICAAACPMSAIKLEPGSDSEETAQHAKAEVEVLPGKSLVVFVCFHSGSQAAKYIADRIGTSTQMIEVPCAGTVDETHILEAFREGAKGVIVSGCFKGNCASVYGTSLAEEKTRRVAAFLAGIGMNSDPVMFLPLAGNRPGALLTALNEMEKKISR